MNPIFRKSFALYPGKNQSIILLTYLRTLIINRFKSVSSSGTFSFGPYSLSYPNYGSLYVMFKEVFVDQNYYLPPTDKEITIVDCGSSLGASVLYFKIMCQNAIVYAFEPNPTTFKFLEKNVTENKFDHVKLHNVALSSVAGSATFYTDKNFAASQGASLTKHLASKDRQLEELDVTTAKLSDLLPEQVDVLKLDIEGAEGGVIEDLTAAGRLSDFKIVFLEYHYDGVNTKYPLGKILRRLEEAGFEYSIVSNFRLPFIKPKKVFSYKITAYKKGIYS